MLFQIEQLDAKGIRTIFDSVFFFFFLSWGNIFSHRYFMLFSFHTLLL